MTVDTPQHDDLIAVLLEDKHVREPAEEHAAHVAVDPRIERWRLLRPAGGGADRLQKLCTKAGALGLIP
jgi:hypothetical protein